MTKPQPIASRRHDVRPGRAFVAVAILVLAFAVLAFAVISGLTQHFDQAILMSMRSSANVAEPIGPSWLREFMRDVTALGSFAFLGFVTVSVVAYLLLVNKRGLALLLIAAVGGGQLLNTLLKMSFDRPRPDLPYASQMLTASFPSGHAAMSAITFLTLGAMLSRATPSAKIRAYFIGVSVFLTLVVGWSRAYLGVHYATDVLAGWLVAAAWAILCWTLALSLQKSGEVEPPGSSS